MDALIFDFDGVVIDSEPIHLACSRQVLETIGVELTKEDYYREYLGYDDRDCIVAAGLKAGIELDANRIDELIAAKTQLVQRTFRRSVEPLPGAADLISSTATAGIPLAICSGALREEIELACEALDVREHFLAIVAAHDVTRGKPDPQGYRLAMERLREATRRNLEVGLCVVIEDSPTGIDAAHAAGMKVLAVTNSYPAEMLSTADKTVESLVGVTLDSLDELSENCAR